MTKSQSLKLTSFSGSTNDNFAEVESLLQAAIQVGNVADTAQASFLKLNLSGGALRFYNSLPNDTQANLVAALTALRNRYNQVANQEFHRICFNDRKCDSAKETPKDFIVDLQRLAPRAFLDVVGGANAINRAEEHTPVKEAFIQGMPLKFKRKLLKEDPARTVDDLGRLIIKNCGLPKPIQTTRTPVLSNNYAKTMERLELNGKLLAPFKKTKVKC